MGVDCGLIIFFFPFVHHFSFTLYSVWDFDKRWRLNASHHCANHWRAHSRGLTKWKKTLTVVLLWNFSLTLVGALLWPNIITTIWFGFIHSCCPEEKSLNHWFSSSTTRLSEMLNYLINCRRLTTNSNIITNAGWNSLDGSHKKY